MRIQIRAIGQLRRGPEEDLLAQYRVRLPYPLDIQEILLPKRLGHKKWDENALKTEEGILLLQGLPADVTLVALDEHGKQKTSEEFSTFLENQEREGKKSLVFLIGGACGLCSRVLEKSAFQLSLGQMTWPHLLVRGLLVEQLYRAHQIRHNHPYHK